MQYSSTLIINYIFRYLQILTSYCTFFSFSSTPSFLWPTDCMYVDFCPGCPPHPFILTRIARLILLMLPGNIVSSSSSHPLSASCLTKFPNDIYLKHMCALNKLIVSLSLILSNLSVRHKAFSLCSPRPNSLSSSLLPRPPLGLRFPFCDHFSVYLLPVGKLLFSDILLKSLP